MGGVLSFILIHVSPRNKIKLHFHLAHNRFNSVHISLTNNNIRVEFRHLFLFLYLHATSLDFTFISYTIDLTVSVFPLYKTWLKLCHLINALSVES